MIKRTIGLLDGSLSEPMRCRYPMSDLSNSVAKSEPQSVLASQALLLQPVPARYFALTHQTASRHNNLQGITRHRRMVYSMSESNNASFLHTLTQRGGKDARPHWLQRD